MSSQVEDIKSRIDVADLVGSYLKLQKAGVNFKARCPFHNEKSASFFVSPARQIWHCFGCQKGGDVFKFLMEIEGCEFREALNNLAQRAGVELKRESPQLQDERSKQFAILEEAARFFENNLFLNQVPLDYLKNRGLSAETIKEFRLGYVSNDWRTLFNHLSAKGYKAQDIESAGLIIKSENNYYDRFRGRIIFPIFNQGGKVVAFGGRIFETPTAGREPSMQNAGAKYVNSPETALYQKSKILYGLHKSKIEILRENSCVLVEGYMDFLSAYQAGTKNAAAVSGTALTSDQLKILNRFCEKLIVSFDMDEAGEGAAKRGIDLALNQGFDVKVLKLPNGFKDPADTILADKKLWLDSLQEACHIVQFYIDSAKKKFLAGSPELSREIQRSVLPGVASLSSDLEQAHWVREISAILNIKEEAVWNALQKTQNTSSQNTNKTQNEEILETAKIITRKELLENRVLGIVAKYPELLEKQSAGIEQSLFSGEKQTAFAEIRNGTGGGLKDFISRLVLEAELFLEGVESAEAEFIKCARELHRENLKEKMTLLSAKINYAEKNNKENLSSLLLEFKNLSDKMNKT